MRPIHLLTAVLLCAAFPTAQATSYVELYQQMPVPSTDIAATRAAVQDGRITAPELLRFKQVLQDEKAAITALNGGAYPEPSDTAPEIPSTDTLEVRSAARAFAGYLATNAGDRSPAKAMTKRSRWVQRAKGQQQRDLAKRAGDCPEPCAEIAAQRERLIGEELVAWDTLFKDWQTTRAPMLATAQPMLAATDFGAKAGTPEGKHLIARYRAAMLEEIEVLFSVTEIAVLRTDAFSRNAGDTMPDALSGATKKSKSP
ncbi:MAG: hypothetical protein M3O62_08215 [Pseudomonadota bacterium]|nr:hypothetical protein [Pseudomonadota bacterium]